MFVFLLGRPGCGKSVVFKRIKEYLSQKIAIDELIRVDDFPKLWAIFQEEEKIGQWKRCRKTEDGGYKVIDDTVWDEILKSVNSDLQVLKSPNKIIFVEFSRPNYIHALRNFSDDILSDSVIIYIDASFETCWKRNVERHLKALAAGTDDHLVSREEMEKTYLIDDKDELSRNPPAPLLVISTEWEGEGRLNEVSKDAAEFIKRYLVKYAEAGPTLSS